MKKLIMLAAIIGSLTGAAYAADEEYDPNGSTQGVPGWAQQAFSGGDEGADGEGE
jgi:hypothetical protein